ncbi:Bug family tripartite tricarboxylate transporter substrate binding protein [Cupriavidus necator]|uniref:Bug family tripartite tricarboxylate transporter substrate binding protein n=1 Tax=Cupriavidus necator TaxID=106590 RepID=UPI0006918530|nr:tripartite tricarboxylate transporter substrate binding protein [Cupriavidus necator]
MKNLLARILMGTGLMCALAAPIARADEYPSRPIRLVVPYAAGGAGDVIARLVAEHVSKRLGQPIIADNRPGAATVLAASQVARSAPDGYTLLFGTLAHSLNATLQTKLPFDPVNDFEFIGKVGQVSFLLVTKPRLPVNDLRGLVALMQKQPGKLTFGSAGVGSPMHLGGELLKHLSNTDAVHVPYKGESAALTDLLGGQLDFMLCTTTTCASRVKDGTLKALAVTSPQRSPVAPSIPTTAEAGIPGFQVYTWVFLASPKGTPSTVVDRLQRALNEVLANPQFKQRALAIGFETNPHTSPAALKSMVQSEILKWRPIIKASGMESN